MITTKYCLTLGASFLAWIVPVSIPQTPRPVVLFSFLASGAGYLYALSLATPMSDQQWYSQQERVQEREILIHDFALKEMVLKASLENQYLGSAQVEKEYVASDAEQQKLANPPEPKLLPDALPESLKEIIEVVKNNGGNITQRDLGRKMKLKADQVQKAFKELQARGYGNLTSDGRTYTFHLTRQLS